MCENDLGGGIKGEAADAAAPRPADVVVAEIVAAGGKAVADYHSVEHGGLIIETAVAAFGKVDILINNAGILRDRSFKGMSPTDWELIMTVRRARARPEQTAGNRRRDTAHTAASQPLAARHGGCS